MGCAPPSRACPSCAYPPCACPSRAPSGRSRTGSVGVGAVLPPPRDASASSRSRVSASGRAGMSRVRSALEHRGQGSRPYRRRDLLVEHGGQRGQGGGPAQRVPALDGDVQHHAERPEVGGRVALRAADALGGYVVGRADEGARRGEAGRLTDGGDAEVREDGAAVGSQQDVGGLDVTVLDAHRVGGAEGGEDAAPQLGGVGGCHGAGGEPVVQGGAGHQLHHDPRVAVLAGVDDVVDGDHVGVVDPGQGAGLTEHPGAQGAGALGVVLRERRVRGPHLLERDVAVERLVAGPPDHAHAAAAEPLDQRETAVDHPSRGDLFAHGP
ncbi:hypothetical protein SBADM41S_09122 [Streptomyces badius]